MQNAKSTNLLPLMKQFLCHRFERSIKIKKKSFLCLRKVKLNEIIINNKFKIFLKVTHTIFMRPGLVFSRSAVPLLEFLRIYKPHILKEYQLFNKMELTFFQNL